MSEVSRVTRSQTIEELRKQVASLQSQMAELKASQRPSASDKREEGERISWKPIRKVLTKDMTDVRMDEVSYEDGIFSQDIIGFCEDEGGRIRNIKWDAVQAATKYSREQMVEAFVEEGVDVPEGCSKGWLAMIMASDSRMIEWLNGLPMRKRDSRDASIWD